MIVVKKCDGLEIAHKAREPFKGWIPAFAGMTAWLGAAYAGTTTGLFGGLRQKSPNPPYMKYAPSP
jgi:hypothetical protein